MNWNYLIAAVVALGIVTAFAVLGTQGVITGDQAVTSIMTISGVILGGGAVFAGTKVPTK